MLSAPPPLAHVTPHERVRKLLLNHLQIIERAAQDQAADTLGRAGRISGVNPADISLLMVALSTFQRDDNESSCGCV